MQISFKTILLSPINLLLTIQLFLIILFKTDSIIFNNYGKNNYLYIIIYTLLSFYTLYLWTLIWCGSSIKKIKFLRIIGPSIISLYNLYLSYNEEPNLLLSETTTKYIIFTLSIMTWLYMIIFNILSIKFVYLVVKIAITCKSKKYLNMIFELVKIIISNTKYILLFKILIEVSLLYTNLTYPIIKLLPYMIGWLLCFAVYKKNSYIGIAFFQKYSQIEKWDKENVNKKR